jgi:hypothetical protein
MLEASMADLEKHAIKRDRRFLVRLVVLLVIGTVAGILLFMKMTSPETATCAADAFGPAAPADAGP